MVPRLGVLGSSVLVVGWFLAGLAWGASPHFVSCNVDVQSDGTVCVQGKEAGLGGFDQVHITLTVVAHCQNPGGNDPEAQNKETFGGDFTEPVQNGKANYIVCVATEFTPDCSPPHTVVVDAVTLVDTTAGISCSQASQ